LLGEHRHKKCLICLWGNEMIGFLICEMSLRDSHTQVTCCQGVVAIRITKRPILERPGSSARIWPRAIRDTFSETRVSAPRTRRVGRSTGIGQNQAGHMPPINPTYARTRSLVGAIAFCQLI
jgi:hypothetical protein